MPYRYADVQSLEEAPLVGSGQCVDLVKHYAKAPATFTWKQGGSVLDQRNIPIGTAIATFVNKKYQSHPHDNHAAFFLARQGDCILVMDQWPAKGRITSRLICPKGRFKNGEYHDPSNNAEAFSIIE